MKRLSVRPITLVRFDDWRKISITLKMPEAGVLSVTAWLQQLAVEISPHHSEIFDRHSVVALPLDLRGLPCGCVCLSCCSWSAVVRFGLSGTVRPCYTLNLKRKAPFSRTTLRST